MARGVPCMSCAGCAFALLVFCVYVCLWGCSLLPRVSGGALRTCTVAQDVCAAFLQGLAWRGAAGSGNIRRGACARTWEFTRLCVGCERSWGCGLLLVDGVFALRPLRPVQLDRGDDSNTHSVHLPYILNEVTDIKVLNTVAGA